ncbi:endo-1,4-beta-xylanase [Niveibacterium sp. SC-1]|uniref:endo-1,4-beta-xylanase n=1 Tax=Niveibacterium sp. SC-1 TaxID=3135646 RepID=UPI0031201B1D
MIQRLLRAGLLACTALCLAPQVPAADKAGGKPVPSLAETYAPYFPVGAAITPGQVMMGNGGDFIARQFSVVVAENAMKPQSLNKFGPGRYEFEAADALVDFAGKHGIKVRGHALVWHQQAADWMFYGSGPNGDATREELTERLRTYIHDVVGHFKGRVWAWDVVNEAFVPDESVAQEGGWRKSHWYRILGPDYIALAFQFAHEADPEALLFYNDYGTESPRKRTLILALIRDLQKRGVPIHGIGHQSHYTIAQPADFGGLETTIEDVGALGLTNHITELDISLNANLMKDAISEVTPALLKLQAARYRDFFEMCLRQQKVVSAMLMWGLNDDVSWLRTWPFARMDAPLLFDGALKP